ncbi:unnamed protein product [Phytophthora fragariaefolia]|uniref:Unnamed protein product n=1 Tax=Phytophthora fragariaefolia TaxID=1490495 RepID=A0A9W6YGN8_9STRA|nr:unnamed protein product [Phytophthora fragariaefolia]
MARWLSFFVEYNFEVKYKPGKQNALADALSRRLDYELAHVSTVTSSFPDLIRASYASDDMCVALLKAPGSKGFEDSDKELSARLRARLHRYAFDDRLLYYSTGSDDPPRVVVPYDEDLNGDRGGTKDVVQVSIRPTRVHGHQTNMIIFRFEDSTKKMVQVPIRSTVVPGGTGDPIDQQSRPRSIWCNHWCNQP